MLQPWRQAFDPGIAFGGAGAYERVTGKARGELDPAAARLLLPEDAEAYVTRANGEAVKKRFAK